ncbi:hypothetical protein V494_05498 [Pseudogymnoascus sp. VKM F-4513 (FW-928)]|nr:hypothetical protein V494_05498 [Pseudogymnoascus sp. VKM F-4513 (FW-928)]
MKSTSYLLGSAIAAAASVAAQGSGPYPASRYTEDTLSDHTFYMPTDSQANVSLPLLVWGNGACSNDGTAFEGFLTNIASYGYLVVANGPPGGSGSSTADMLGAAVSWVSDSIGTNEKYASVDISKVAAAGQSCGGIEAYSLRNDDRVSLLGIFNSGFLPDTAEGPDTIGDVHKPTFYFLGGSEDIAYENGERDYHALTGVPKWVGNFPVGHGGTYWDVDGGAFGVAAVSWLEWGLKGDTAAAEFFTAGGAEANGWIEVESEGLDGLLS